MSKLTNGATSTWDGETNTITWTGTSNNMISNFDFGAGDYKQYSKIGVNITSITNAEYVRIQIRANGKELTQLFYGTGVVEKSLTSDYGFTVADLEKFEWARMLGSSAFTGGASSASAVISSVYLEAPTRTKEVDLSAMAESKDNATWNNSTHTFAWTGTWSNAIELPSLSGNLSAYTTVNYVTAAGTCDHFRILIYYSNDAAQTTYYASVGTKSITFADMGVVAANLAHVSSIKISGASDATGDITLTNFSLEGPLVNYIKATTTYAAPAGATDLKDLQPSWSISYPKDIANETSWGGNIDSNDGAADISSYDYLHFVVSSASGDANAGLRVFVWDGSERITLYPHPIAEYADVTDWKTTSWITTSGTYVVDISGNSLFRGMKALQGWAGNAGTVTVSQAYLSSGAPKAYIPSGKYTLIGETAGTSALTAALADASTTFYDATGVVGTGIGLTPTGNPNALFKANSGVLANDNNVIVSDACAQLALTDGYPFKAPVGFTATAAPTYDRAFTASTTTTVCLPFALTAAEAATLGTFYELSSVDGTTLHFTSVAAPVANKAYLVVPTATGLTLSETGKSIAATPADLGTTVSGVDFIGTLAATTIPASDGSYSYYAYNNGSLVKITTNAATLPAFRGYFKVAGASARSLNISLDNEATGISTLLMNNGKVNNEVYNLKGQRVSQPKKGLYIVNGKKVIK